MKVLISAPYLQREIKNYKDIFERNGIDLVLPKTRERLSEEELMGIISQIDGTICGDDAFTKRVLDKAKNLKVIVKWGVGIDSIDSEYARKLGISVFNTPGAFSDPVADTVMAFILCFARKTIELDKNIKNGVWKKDNCYALSEQTIGIVGLGNIGMALAKRANSFGMMVLGNDIKEISEDILARYNIKLVDKNILFSRADYVSLNCDLNESSYRLISLDEIKKMKKTAVIINTARGPIINEKDLITAMERKMIRGIALDVFEEEPLPQSSPLRKFNNVLVSPHNANSSPYFAKKVHENSISQLLRGLNIQKINAIFPMRAGSQGVRNKDTRIVNGKPLYEYIMETLFKSDLVDKIIISTDIPEIIEKYRNNDKVILIKRPRELRGNCNINWVIKDILNKVKGEYFLQVHTTSSLLKKDTLNSAIKKFFENLPKKQSLFSVNKLQKRFWWKDGKPINHNPKDQPTTQILEPYFEENSCIYAFTRSSFKKNNNRIGENPCLFEIKAIEAIDIDREEDSEITDKLLKN